jgi:hypothetical protein
MTFLSTLGKYSGAAAVGSALTSVARDAGTGFLQGAIGSTAAAGMVKGFSGSGTGAKKNGKQTGPSGDSGKDTVNAIRDLQSDFNSQGTVLNNISVDIAHIRDLLTNIGTLLVASNGITQNALNSNNNAAMAAAAAAAAAAGLPKTSVKPAAPIKPATPGVPAAKAPTATPGVPTAKAVGTTIARGVGRQLPYVGGVISGGLEYAESGDIGRSIASGVGTTAGTILGGLAGFGVAGPPGAVVGSLGGGYAGDKAVTGLYDRFFGSGDKTEKMAELESKETQRKESVAQNTDRENITFNSKELIS